jgi:hypothetical protein
VHFVRLPFVGGAFDSAQYIWIVRVILFYNNLFFCAGLVGLVVGRTP